MRFQYEVISAEGKGVPVRCAFHACVALCVVSCALAASCVAPARAHASAPGPGIEMSADNGGVAVSDGAVADAGPLGGATAGANAISGGADEPADVSGGEPIVASAVAGTGAEVPENVGASDGGRMSEDVDVVGDAGWKTQLGAWLLANNPSAVETALQQARADSARAEADAAAAKAQMSAASDHTSAAVALALANLAAGLVMLAAGRVKSRSTR